MRLFHKKQTILPIPAGFTADSIRIESSICTGETTIGFYNPSEKRLMFAELVQSEAEIAAFYAKYGVIASDVKKKRER